jgi:hypothetical protein
MKKVFLGGTCNESTWREHIKPLLNIPYFDPVVEDWNEEAQREEERQKDSSDIHLYVITKEMTGVFSIAEAVDSAWRSSLSKTNKFKFPGPKHTVMCVIPEGFDKRQLKSLRAVGRLVNNRGEKYFESLNEVADFINSFA